MKNDKLEPLSEEWLDDLEKRREARKKVFWNEFSQKHFNIDWF